MRMALLACGLVIAGCTPDTNPAGGTRTQVQRDVESYAIASCLTQQAEPYLKDQGDAWASVIVQRMHGDIEVRSEEHTSELQSQSNLVCRLLLEKKKNKKSTQASQKKSNTGRSWLKQTRD